MAIFADPELFAQTKSTFPRTNSKRLGPFESMSSNRFVPASTAPETSRATERQKRMSLFDKPLLGDEFSPKKNAPLIFMPITVIAVGFALCGIVANFVVLIHESEGNFSQ